MLMGCTDALADLVANNQLLLECFICVEDVGWHSCCSGQGDHQGSEDLIEALVDIDRPPGEVSVAEGGPFKQQGGGVRGIGRPSPSMPP